MESGTPDRGLSKARRVLDSALFREAFDQGRRFPGALMVLWLRSGPGAALRVGVVAARKSFPRSVDRSRARRCLREAFRINRFRFRGDADVILLARTRILTADSRDIEADLVKLATRAGLARREQTV